MLVVNERNHNLDVIKAFAIVSVVLLHSAPKELLLKIGAPFHIWQAVPLFIMLTGYNFAGSFNRRKISLLNDFYSLGIIKRRIRRIVVPFLVVWIIQVFIYSIYVEKLEFNSLFLSFVTGGWGPGSYYVPIIVQAIIIMPIMFIFHKRNNTKALLFFFTLNLLLELLCVYVGVSESFYRLLIIRYLFAISLGIWMFFNGKNIKKPVFLLGGLLAYCIYMLLTIWE